MPCSDCRQRSPFHPINRVAAFDRNHWPLWIGSGGRLPSESLAALPRIPQYCCSCKAYAMPSARSSRPNAAAGCLPNASRQRARSRARGRPSRSWNSISKDEPIGTVHHSGDHARSIPHQRPVRPGCWFTPQQLQVARSSRVRVEPGNGRQTLQALVPKCARKRTRFPYMSLVGRQHMLDRLSCSEF